MKKRIVSFVLVLAMLIGFAPFAVLPASAAAMETSENGIFLIQGFEGFRANAYRDGNGWSIGYGTASEEGATITREEADRLMREHVKTLEPVINSFASTNRLSLTQAQFDALISFSYNCSTGWTREAGKFRSAVINRATGNDFLYAICLWANDSGVPSTGLINRRLAEANLYLNGRYSTTPPSNYTYVLFDANGGSVGEDLMQGYDVNLAAPIKAANPTHSNATLKFAGWYTAKTGGAKVTSLTAANRSKTIYALWGMEVRVTNSFVNVRNAPGVSGTTPIGKLNMGDRVVIFETKEVNGSLWGRYEGGWIALMYTNYDALMDAHKEGGTGQEIVATAVVSCSTSVNVRNKPGTVGTTIVGKLTNGTEVEIYEIQDLYGHKWGRISSGWFCLDYAICKTGSFQETSDSNTGSGSTGGNGSGSTAPAEPVLRTGTVSGTFVNVRNGPGTIGTSVKYQLRQGEKVSFYEFRTVNKHQWGRINKHDWICMDYVTLDPVSSGSTGSTGTVAIGTVTFPMDTPILNARGERIATATAGTTLSVYGILPETLCYQVTGGYVAMEGLELMLAAAIPFKTVCELKAYDTPGDMTSEIATVRMGAKITLTRFMLKGETLWGYTSDAYVDGWVNIEYLELDEEAIGSGGTGTTPGGSTGTTPGGSTGGNTGSTPSETVLRTGFVDNTYVNVRNAPGTVGTTVIDKLNSGAKVSIYEFREVNRKQWARIGTNRWVCMDYITLDPQGGSTGGNTGSTPTTPEVPTGDTIATGFVTSDKLNIRSGAGLAYGTVGTLYKNNRFYVYETKLNNNMIWGRIGTNRWICLSYTLLDSTGTVTGEGEMGTIMKTYHAANIRSGPGSGYALMGKMLVNSRVEILEIKNGNGTQWGRTSVGWISMEYVMLDSQLPPGMIPGTGDGTGTAPGGSTGGDTGTVPGGSTGGNTGTTPGGNPGTTPGGSTGNGNTDALYTGVVILTNALKIRQAPTTSAMELGTLARNTQVTIYELAIGNGMAWGRCDKGWISLTYVDLRPASGNGAVDARVVQYDGLNIRETPGTRSKSLGTYSKGTVVDIFEFSGNWGRTKDGWVCLDYLLT